MTELNYYGATLSDAQMDLLALERIPEGLRKGEPALYATKWWNYRVIHPVRATLMFAEYYRRAYLRVCQKRIATSEVSQIRVFQGENPLKEAPEKVTGFWKGRRAADELGIPYRFYCHNALEASEYLDWTYLARPEDLTNSALVTRIGLAWHEAKKWSIQLPSSAIYGQEGQRGYYQDAWESDLCAQIARRRHPRYALQHHVTRTRMLSEAKAREFFGNELTDSLSR